MSAAPTRARLLWLAPVAVAGVLTLLASSATVDDDDNDNPAVVDWVLGSLAAPLVRDRGDLIATMTNLRLAGSYEAQAGDEMTIDRDRLPIDATSGFDLELVPDDPDNEDTLAGSFQMDVLSEIDFGLDHDPRSGQYSVIANGTTTIVTAQEGSVRVETGGGQARTLEWGDLRDAADDPDQDDDLRFASYAFNALSEIVQLALLGEEVMELTEDDTNRELLEDMGLDEPLDLPCGNAGGGTGGGSGESVLIWRIDAPGSGEGDIGEGDSMEMRFENCFSTSLQRFREGTIVMDDYVPARGDAPRTRSGEFDFGTLFISEEEITISTVPTPTSPRIDGGLLLQYEESLVDPAP